MFGVTHTKAEVVLVDRPEDECIFVALSRVRRCYAEQGNEVWAGGKGGPGNVGDRGLVQHKMSSRLDNAIIVRLNPHPHCTRDLLLDREVEG